MVKICEIHGCNEIAGRISMVDGALHYLCIGHDSEFGEYSFPAICGRNCPNLVWSERKSKYHCAIGGKCDKLAIKVSLGPKMSKFRVK